MQLGVSLRFVRLLPGGDRPNVFGASEDRCACGGPAVGEAGVVEVGVGD
jgi:hypothetical protein